MVKQSIAAAVLGVGVFLTVALPASAQQARQNEPEQIRARQNISTMEGILEKAVLNGAESLQRRLEAVMPDAATLSGEPQVRGFRLENYGVFFDVEVPALRLSIAWMVRTMPTMPSPAARTALAEIRAAAAALSGAERDRILQAIQRMEVTLGLVGPPRIQQRGTIGAADAFNASQTAPVQQSVLPANPNEAWTEEVKSALVEAMLNYSNALSIGPEEWLTVAARDNIPADPLVAGDLGASTTVIFRVKGSDLAAWHARKISIEEARKRVELREY